LNVPVLDSFGYSEDNLLEHHGLRYFALSIPDRHGERVDLFETWAKTTDRNFGAQEKDRTMFRDGSTAPAPKREAGSLPPWLK